MDLFFVNGMLVLMTIDAPVRNRAIVCLDSRKADCIYSALDVVLRNYNKQGYYVWKICCDSKFKPIMEDIQDEMDAEIDCVPQGEHVQAVSYTHLTLPTNREV